jgi:hypothetical protein
MPNKYVCVCVCVCVYVYVCVCLHCILRQDLKWLHTHILRTFNNLRTYTQVLTLWLHFLDPSEDPHHVVLFSLRPHNVGNIWICVCICVSWHTVLFCWPHVRLNIHGSIVPLDQSEFYPFFSNQWEVSGTRAYQLSVGRLASCTPDYYDACLLPNLKWYIKDKPWCRHVRDSVWCQAVSEIVT